MGLATVSIQTAAGSANPELTIDGVLEAEALRDFLYTKMRGVRDHAHGGATTPHTAAARRHGRRRGRSARAAHRDPRWPAPARGTRRRTGARRVTHQVDAAAAWIYRGVWASVVGVFKVPEEPSTLPAAGEPVRSLRPSPGYLRYLKFLFWIALIPGDVLPVVAWIAVSIAVPMLGVALAPLFLALMFLPDVFAYVGIHLRYDTTWYVLTDRSLRIRRGIMTIHETTISFENVQNVEVTQGPLQRYFGIADVIVQTAGGGAAHGHGKGQAARRSARTSASCRDWTTRRPSATRFSPASSGRDRPASATSIRRTSTRRMPPGPACRSGTWACCARFATASAASRRRDRRSGRS